MIVILHPDADLNSAAYQRLAAYLACLPDIHINKHQESGTEHCVTELYLIGSTTVLDAAEIEAFEVVERVVRVSREYRILGRHGADNRASHFDYNGVRFGQDTFHVFAGLCAVNNQQDTDAMLKALGEQGQVCARMGAYKPRTNPYSFQGLGMDCLPYVFESAGKYGIKVVTMEITHEAHIDEIQSALADAGQPTGVMLQIGTRNTQNFELLKAVGRQRELPVLFKRVLVLLWKNH